MQPKYAVYQSEEKEKGFSGYFNTTDFFLIFQIDNETSFHEGKNILQRLGQRLGSGEVESLSNFENILDKAIKDLNLPVNFSLTAGYIKEGIFYLKTIGNGEVLLKRGSDVGKIVSNGQSASGYIQGKDKYVFTTSHFTDVFPEKEIKKILDEKNLDNITKRISDSIKNNEEKEQIAFFIDFSSPLVGKSKFSPLKNLFSEINEIKIKAGNRNFITIIAVSLIFIIFLWSVVFSYQRRNENAVQKKISASRMIINQKLTESEDIAFLNMARSQALIAEAQTELDNLKSQIGNNNKKDITELENLISEKLNKITKKEEKSVEEFYDLTVDNKKAKGIKLGIDNDQLAVLDTDNGAVYLLSLSKKSLNKKIASQIKSSSIVAVSDLDVFFFVPEDGIYEIADQKNVKKIINNDADWGKITDLNIYNKNIYLLDSAKNQIYKYSITDEGYSDKSLYLKDQPDSFNTASSLAIDSSVYVSLKDYILKFTAGLRDGFKTDFPESVDSLNRVITGKDLEKIYVWDKEKGALYILGKDGIYEKQVKTSALSKADDIAVYNNEAFILIKEKIFSLNLE